MNSKAEDSCSSNNGENIFNSSSNMNYIPNANLFASANVFVPSGSYAALEQERHRFFMSLLDLQNENPQILYTNGNIHQQQQQWMSNMNQRNQNIVDAQSYEPAIPFDPCFSAPNNVQIMNQPISFIYSNAEVSSKPQNQTKAQSVSLPELWKNDHRIFLMFVHVLFKILKQNKRNQIKDKELLINARTIVIECTVRNRAGDSKFTPLVEIIERKLRCLNGIQAYWNEAEKYVIKYNFRKEKESQNFMRL